jgi:hypothetical protein
MAFISSRTMPTTRTVLSSAADVTLQTTSRAAQRTAVRGFEELVSFMPLTVASGGDHVVTDVLRVC